MKRLIKHHFVRFCIVGLLGFIINFILLSLFYKKLHWPLFVAQLLAGEIALFNNFILHHNWTYSSHNVKKTILQLIVQFHVTSWIAIIGTALIVSFCVTYLHLNYFIALLIGGFIALIWNFIWSKFVIWRHHEVQPQSNNLQD